MADQSKKEREQAARAAITKSAKKSGGIAPGSLSNIILERVNKALQRKKDKE